MIAKNLYHSLIISLIWGGLFIIPAFVPNNEMLAYSFITLLCSLLPYTLQMDTEIESKKRYSTLELLRHSVTSSIIVFLFFCLVILNELIDKMYPNFYPIRYIISSLIVISYSFKLRKIWANKQNILIATTKDGIFTESSNGIIRYNPNGIWSKKCFLLNTISDKHRIQSILYNYNIAFIFSIIVSVWQENLLLFLIINVGIYILKQHYLKKFTNKLTQQNTQKTLKDVVKLQAKEMDYFALIAILTIFLHLTWQMVKEATLVKEDIVFDIIGIIILIFLSAFISSILFYKIKYQLNKSTK